MAGAPTPDQPIVEQALTDQHDHKKRYNLFMQAPAAIALLEGPIHFIKKYSIGRKSS